MRIHGHAVLTRVSRDTRRLMDDTCQRHGVRLSDFLREAIFDRLAAEGLPLPPEAAFSRPRPCAGDCREAAR